MLRVPTGKAQLDAEAGERPRDPHAALSQRDRAFAVTDTHHYSHMNTVVSVLEVNYETLGICI